MSKAVIAAGLLLGLAVLATESAGYATVLCLTTCKAFTL